MLEGLAQACFEPNPLQRAGIDGGVVELVHVPAVFLGVVHGDVGIPHQRFDLLAVIGVHADADAGRDAQLVAL